MSMRALRGGQLYFVISLLKVINGGAVLVSLARPFKAVYCYPAWEFRSIQVEGWLRNMFGLM